MTADHGGIEKKHGGDSDQEMTSFFAAAGDGLFDDKEIGPMNIKDITAIILYAFGIKDDGIEGTVPTGVFN